MDSILSSVKKVLHIDADYTAFDVDIILHINSVFTTLQQLGIGPEEGFSISSAEQTWNQYLEGDKNLNSVKTYMYLRVRLLFDSPETSHARQAMVDQATELEWRLNVYREGIKTNDHGR